MTLQHRLLATVCAVAFTIGSAGAFAQSGGGGSGGGSGGASGGAAGAADGATGGSSSGTGSTGTDSNQGSSTGAQTSPNAGDTKSSGNTDTADCPPGKSGQMAQRPSGPMASTKPGTNC